MKTMFLPAAFAALLCLGGCQFTGPASSAAENGLKKDLECVGELLAFKEVRTTEQDLPEGRGVLLYFESEVKWLTLEEAAALKGGPRDTQAYLAKLEYISSRLGSGPKAGRRELIKGALLLLKTDVGWIYKGLALR
ncbi:MAG: hypothetical protein A2X35_00825 [Elusimicrobia bacterium GWA2_61_42]|nr:MAG: hypothetical protein A2X35_00825 [Elusimicrobia bacterium GWA2_61_42]